MELPLYSQLTKEQINALKIPLDQSCIVTGPPGSGKTAVAIHRADEANTNGKSTRLIMYNRVLHGYTKSAADDLELEGEQTTFHSWFSRLYRREFGRSAPEIERWVYDWNEIIANLGTRKIRDSQDIDVIIDEGQDLPKEFFYFANQLGATTSIFADENQRITNTQSTLREIQINSGIGNIITLRENFRNTRQIAELGFAISRRTGSPTVTESESSVANLREDRQGPKPWLYPNTDIDRIVEMMLRSAVNSPGSQIGVLTQRLPLQRQLFRKLTAQAAENSQFNQIKIQYYDSAMRNNTPEHNAINWRDKGIKLVNFNSAKGVEFDIVFLPELNRLEHSMGDPEEPSTARMFYMLVTRARDGLILSYDGSGEPRIMRLFPKECLQVAENRQGS